MKLGKVRFERYKKFLKCFDKDAKELQKDAQLFQKDEQIMNQQEQLFQKDEQIKNQQEKLISYAKLLKSVGKTILEIKEATGLTTDEIQKM